MPVSYPVFPNAQAWGCWRPAAYSGDRDRWKDLAPVTQDQVAATLAALLGYDYCAAVPKAGKRLPDVMGR